MANADARVGFRLSLAWADEHPSLLALGPDAQLVAGLGVGLVAERSQRAEGSCSFGVRWWPGAARRAMPPAV
jgi:hypothetical protein